MGGMVQIQAGTAVQMESAEAEAEVAPFKQYRQSTQLQAVEVAAV